MHADAVDRSGRFPAEAFAAARAQGLLGAMIPTSLGGDGASASDIIDVCHILGRACASTGMIYAMHQIMVACLIRHGGKAAWALEMQQRIAAEQLLLASSTTDGQGGGDLRHSSCAVRQEGTGIELTKSATVMSYGAQADAVLATARRSPDAAPSDQVLVAVIKEQYSLEPSVDWDTLGMRGTCSSGFTLEGQCFRQSGLRGCRPGDQREDGAADGAPHLERGLVRRRRRCSRARAQVRRGVAQRCGRAATARRRASDARQRDPGSASAMIASATDAIRRPRNPTLTASKLSSSASGTTPAQGECVGDGYRDGDERAAGDRAVRLPQ